MSFVRRLSPFFVVAILLGAAGCSSTKPSGDAASGNPDSGADAATTQSSADQVGSVPEDMLADEKGVESSAKSETPAASSSDPFGDLKEKSAPEASTEVADQNELPKDGSDTAGKGNSGKFDTYTVKAGDTLMKIAFHLYGDVDRWKDLHELNQAKLKSGSALRKGMKLKYEAPNEAFSAEQLSHSYLIKKGDTLAGIADDVYGKKMKYKKLQAYNKRLIKNPNRIFAGFTIYYDITEKEMAEAEAHRAQKAAGGGGGAAAPNAVPSALSPPAPVPAPSVAVSPSATDNSAVPGPGAQPGPPAPPPSPAK
jgi:nucleoid-associated protein YgaU